MAVQVATLDILTERAHFDPEVARAIGDAITMEISHSNDELLTKGDLDTFRNGEFHAFRNEFSTFRKGEFDVFRSEFNTFRKNEFDVFRSEFNTFRRDEFDAFRSEFNTFRKNEFDVFRNEFNTFRRDEFDVFRNEFNTFRKNEFDVFRKEFDDFRVEVRQEFVILRAEIRVAIAEAMTDMFRFMFTAMAAQTALIAGIMYFMLQHLR